MMKKASIVIALKHEKRESIETTLRSIEKLNYPKDLMEIILVYRRNDLETSRSVREVLSGISRDIRVREFIIEREEGFKASDINQAIREAEGEIIGFYDADDIIEENQINKALKMLEEGFSAVSARVYRYRPTILGRLLFMETVIWYDLWINIMSRLRIHTPLSGEGLYIRRDVIERLGGFPEILAEDSGLSILLAIRGLKYGYMNSYVEELAPKNLRSFIGQRLRWYRGHLQALTLLLRSRVRPDVLFKVLASYTMIIIPTVLALLPVAVVGSSISSDLNSSSLDMLRRTNDIPRMLGISSMNLVILLLILYLGFISVSWILLFKNHMKRKGFQESIKIALLSLLLLPLYWLLLSITFVLSIFIPIKKWFKTDRR
ncbi:MAG: glycosyltransferase [Sulfolobales archaeon]